MVRDTGCEVVLASEALAGDLAQTATVEIVSLDRWGFDGFSPDNPEIEIDRSGLAYAIFTSGTTGAPKAATITHGGICNFLEWLQHRYRLTAGDKVLQKANISFDVSVWELFWPLMTDAVQVFCEPGKEADAPYLSRLIEAEKITIAGFTSSMLSRFLDEPAARRCTALRWVNFGGDALSVALQRRFFEVLPGCMLHNLYGPAEAAIVTLYWECGSGDDLPFVPIGRPIANTKVYILSDDLQPVAPGEIGEIHLAGIQVATGYHNRPELTRERFLPNPFEAAGDYGTLYRTGDLGRFMADGNIEFLGRRDAQVKINGVRLELGEVESMAGTHTCFKNICVRALPNPKGELRLVLYFVTDESDDAVRIAKEALRTEVPAAAFPSFFIRVPRFDLTANGKIDTASLPSPFHDAGEIARQQMTDGELQVAGIWEKVAGMRVVRATDNLFYAGGGSLEVMSFMASIEAKFGVTLKLDDFVRDPTIQAVAAAIAHELPVSASQ
jgi:amino acid adenylation domain-containing protein